MALWQRGEKDKARTWFKKAAAWTDEKASKDTGLRRLWSDAAELLGQPGPNSAPSTRSEGRH
jgi:hypothetical protein